MSLSQVFRRVIYGCNSGVNGRVAGGRSPGPARAALQRQEREEVSRDIATRAASLIPPLPDEVALPIMNAAHRMIGLPAEEVIRLHVMYADGVRAAVNDGQKRRNSQNDSGLRAVKGFQFSVLPGEQGALARALRPS